MLVMRVVAEGKWLRVWLIRTEARLAVSPKECSTATLTQVRAYFPHHVIYLN